MHGLLTRQDHSRHLIFLDPHTEKGRCNRLSDDFLQYSGVNCKYKLAQKSHQLVTMSLIFHKVVDNNTHGGISEDDY